MEYFIKSSAILIIFYVSYKLLLQKETFFQSIRFYLLTGIFASLILPLIIIPEYVTVEAVNLPMDITPIKAVPSTPEPTLTWQQVLTIIYLTGMAFFFLRFLFRLVSVIHFISSHKKNRSGKYCLIKTQKNISPFSFFNFIVFNDANYSENELEQILNHEKVHVKQFHSFDILLSQIITIIFWFNPFSWLYSKEIRKNLEFIADEGAQNFVKEKKNYQYLLLKTSSPEIKLVLTSNFYNSLIKKRIDMLQKERSQKFMQLKFTLILPVLIAFIFTFNTKVIAQKKEGYTVEIFTDRVDIYEFITKNTKDDELKKMKKEFEENGTQFKYKKLKRNSKGEITGISITVKNKAGNEAKISQSSNQPISPIMIRDSDNGELSIGNVSEKDKNLYKMYLSYKNDDKKENHSIKGNVFTFNSDDEINASNDDHKMVYSSSDKKPLFFLDGKEITDKKPLFFLDGKEITEKEMNAINSEKIKSINVLKGKMAVDKYGEKAKDGVIEITSKKGAVKDDTNASDNNAKYSSKIMQSNGEKDRIIVKSVSSHEAYASENTRNVKKPLFFLDGNEITEKEMNAINSEKIKSINVLKGKTAIDKYGEKAKDGVIEITSKK